MKKGLFLFTIFLVQNNLAMDISNQLALLSKANREEGNNQFFTGNFQEAEKYYTICSTMPESTTNQLYALAELSKINSVQYNNLEKALIFIDEGKKVEGADATSRAFLCAAIGILEAKKGNKEQALQNYSEVFQLFNDPTNGLVAALRAQSGIIQQELGEIEAAKKDYYLALDGLKGTGYAKAWGKIALDRLNILVDLVKSSELS